MASDLDNQLLVNANITGNEPTPHPNDGEPSSKVKVTAWGISDQFSTLGISGDATTINTTDTRFARLPNEILTLIIKSLNPNHIPFQWLLVNKHFYHVANPILWHTKILDDDFFGEPFTTCLEKNTQYQQQPPTSCQHIRVLYLDDDYWTDDRLLWLISKTPNLTFLCIGMRSRVTSSQLYQLPQYCTHLEQLELANVCLSYAFFVAVGQHWHHLSKLVLQSCSYNPSSSEEDDPLVPIVLGCPLLKSLYIKYHKMDGLNLLNETTIATLKNLHGLTTLGLSDEFPSRIPPSILAFPTHNHLPHLTCLELNNGHDLDDTMLIRFVRSHPALERLVLKDVTRLTDACLDGMTANWLLGLKHVMWVNNANFTRDGVQQWIRQSSPTLDSVYFSDCARILPADFGLPSSHGLFVLLDRGIIDTIRQAHQQNNNTNRRLVS